MLFERRVGVHEDDTLRLEFGVDRVEHDLRLVLGRDSGHQALTLRLRDSELLIGSTDVFGEVFPRLSLLLGGAHEVLDVVEVDARQVGTPERHRLFREEREALESLLQHPLRLALERRDVGDDLGGDAASCAGTRGVGVRPAEFINAEVREFRSIDKHVRHCYLFSSDGNRGGSTGIPRTQMMRRSVLVPVPERLLAPGRHRETPT